MSTPYDVFTGAFLGKVSEYDFANMSDFERYETVDGYMKRAISEFRHVCKYDLSSTADDAVREFDVEIAKEDIDELANIISEGMVAQWMRPYTYRQENLENALSTKDFSVYSPANMLLRVKEAYNEVSKRFVAMVREYSYNHGDLSELHL